MLSVLSQDGTTIAYQRVGSGPALVIVGGSLADHHFYAPLAERLGRHFTVYNVDRRGRGESGDTAPYAPEREVEDLAAVIVAAGGTASVYGHSAGSALALRAASVGVSITRLVLADPPFSPPGGDEAIARAAHVAQVRRIEQLNSSGDYRGSVKFFLSDYGLPDEALEEMLDSPGGAAMVAAARVLPYDYAVLGDGVVPLQAAAKVTVSTLVVADQNEPAVAHALVATIPDAEFAPTPSSTHELGPDDIAELVEPFLLRS
jgi:pimeloyl-ACP methyl ester carboxylesterase